MIQRWIHPDVLSQLQCMKSLQSPSFGSHSIQEIYWYKSTLSADNTSEIWGTFVSTVRFLASFWPGFYKHMQYQKLQAASWLTYCLVQQLHAPSHHSWLALASVSSACTMIAAGSNWAKLSETEYLRLFWQDINNPSSCDYDMGCCPNSSHHIRDFHCHVHKISTFGRYQAATSYWGQGPVPVIFSSVHTHDEIQWVMCISASLCHHSKYGLISSPLNALTEISSHRLCLLTLLFTDYHLFTYRALQLQAGLHLPTKHTYSNLALRILRYLPSHGR